jgi:EpsI family protein
VPVGGLEDLLEADDVLYQEARDAGGAELGTVFIAYFRNRKSLAEPHEPEVCYRASGWGLRSADAPLPRAGRALVAQKGAERRLVFFWYETRGGVFEGAWPLKLDLVRASLAGRPTDAALVRLTAPLAAGEDEADALARLDAFARTLKPRLRPLF